MLAGLRPSIIFDPFSTAHFTDEKPLVPPLDIVEFLAATFRTVAHLYHAVNLPSFPDRLYRFSYLATQKKVLPWYSEAEGASLWGICPHLGLTARVAPRMPELTLTDWGSITVGSSELVITRAGALMMLKRAQNSGGLPE